jgi:CheY-like chemotaxis protein
MTLHKALVVDDDPHAIEMVEDVLSALGHEHDSAGSLLEARGFLKTSNYSYVLLDLEFPARSRRCVPRIQNAENFLDGMRESKGKQAIPVIVMSDRSADCAEITVEMMRLAANLRDKGVTDFIHKPFPTAGRTLDRVIKKVLGENGTPRRRKPRRSSAKGKTPRPIPIAKSQEKPSPKKSPWGHIFNEPITLDQFMATYCEKRSKETRKYRRKALLATARNKKRGKGSVALPPPAVPHKNGRPKEYFTHDLLSVWPGFQDEGVDLPSLLSEFSPIGRNM